MTFGVLTASRPHRLRAITALTFFVPFLCQGQTDLSTLRGTATDASGAAVTGSEVKLTDQATNFVRSVLTDTAGNYEIPYLRRGTYRLTATAAGFNTFVADNVVVESNQTRRIDISLTVGQVTAEVTVAAEVSVIEPETSKLGSGFDNKRYVQTPLTFSHLAVWYILSSLPNIQSNNGSIGYSIAGQSAMQSEFSVDGIPNGGRGVVITTGISIEDMDELKLTSVNNSAEFSRIGNYNAVTRSGTNSLHGRLFYLHQNEALNARPSTASRKLRDKGHTFGVNAGGPVIHDRTFFYLGYSGQRLPQDSFNTNSTPSLAMRAGNFSQLPRVIRDPLTGSPFPGNIIPSSRLNATALKFQDSYVPTPNFGGPDLLSGNLRWTHPYAIDIKQADIGTARVDHKLSAGNTLAGKITFARWDYILPGLWPDMPWTRLRHQWTGMISDTHIFNSGLVNEVRWGIHRESWQDGFVYNAADVTSQLGLPAPAKALPAGTPGFPTIAITGYPNFQANGTLGDWIYRPQVFSNSTTWAKGRHVAKFGGNYRQFFNFNGGINTAAFGNYAFNGSLSGDAYGDFLLGLPFTSTRLDPLLNRKRYTSEWGFFAQDTYKITSRLTLEYGLRWEIYRPGKYEDDLQFNWDPATGNVVVPQEAMQAVKPLYPSSIRVVPGQVLYDSDTGNFAPRFGFAYRPWDATVIRGGWGIFNEYRGYDAYVVTGGPFELSEMFFQEIRSGTPLLQFPTAFPATGVGSPPSQSVEGYPLNQRSGYIHQFNLSVEREIRRFGLRLSYLGSRGHGLRYRLNINKPEASLIPFSAARRPYQQFVSATYNFDGGNTKYDALQFQVQRRVSDLMVDFHWTLAHNMNDMLNLENPYHHRYYNRDFTPRMRAVATVAYTLPVGRGKSIGFNMSTVADTVFGGWTLNWLGYFSTGNYFSSTFSGADPSNTNTFGGLPDRVANGNLPPDERKLTRWFDASAFSNPVAGRFGNSGVNVLEGPGLNTQHVSVVKRFRLNERLAADFMLAATDIFNHPNYTFPANNISVPGQVGTITNLYGIYSGGAERGGFRQFEARLRIEF